MIRLSVSAVSVVMHSGGDYSCSQEAESRACTGTAWPVRDPAPLHTGDYPESQRLVLIVSETNSLISL